MNNLLKENLLKAGVVWIRQVGGRLELCPREHYSRPGKEIGKDPEGGMGTVSEEHCLSEVQVFRSSPGSKGESLLTFKIRLHQR